MYVPLLLISSASTQTIPSPQPLPLEEVERLVTRIREHIKCNRIRLADHFQDSDPLRANSITLYRFRQVRTRIVIDISSYAKKLFML